MAKPPKENTPITEHLAYLLAQANREKLGFSGMEKVVAFDHSESLADVAANEAGTTTGNGVVTFPGNIRKKAERFQG